MLYTYSFFFFFFNDTATTEIYTLSLHDALPIYIRFVSKESRFRALNFRRAANWPLPSLQRAIHRTDGRQRTRRSRSEEHTSELQSQSNLVCRLLLEKKKHYR